MFVSRFLTRIPSNSFGSTFARRLSTASNSAKKNVVITDGVRLPFALTSSIYSDQLAVDLQRMAYTGLITKTGLDKADVDYVLAGTVIQEVRTSNLAREAVCSVNYMNFYVMHLC